MGGDDPAPDGRRNPWLAYLNLGWVMALFLGGFTWGGIRLDRHFGTAPIFLLIGVFLAFFACGYSVYRALRDQSDIR